MPLYPTYQPYYGQPYPQALTQAATPHTVVPPTPAPVSVPAQNGSGAIWVQGEAGAKSYLVAPNTSVLLMDSESERFFIKSSDASGIPLPLRVFAYKEVKSEEQAKTPVVEGSAYVTKEEFEAFKNELKTNIPVKKTAKRRLEDEDDE